MIYSTRGAQVQSITANDVNNYAHWFWNKFDPFRIRPLPFRSFLGPFSTVFGNTQHDWDYELVPNGTTFGSLNTQPHVTVQLARLLVETGIAVTPAAQPLTDFRAGFAVVRYAEYFRNQTTNALLPLLLNNDPALRSSRFKACMAEELASGMACYLLREHLDVVHIVDYQVWRNLTNQSLVGTRPDYYCITSTGEALLVEVKGKITTRRVSMSTERAKARLQVTNGLFGVEPERQAGSRITIASNLRVAGGANPRSISYIEQVPPPAISSAQPPALDPAALSYSKYFRYVGLDDAAERTIQGQPLQLDERRLFGIKEPIDDDQYSPLGLDPFGNIILMETDVLNDLNAGNKPKRPSNQKKRHRELSDQPKEKAVIVLNDSVIVYPNPELLGAKPDR